MYQTYLTESSTGNTEQKLLQNSKQLNQIHEIQQQTARNWSYDSR